MGVQRGQETDPPRYSLKGSELGGKIKCFAADSMQRNLVVTVHRASEAWERVCYKRMCGIVWLSGRGMQLPTPQL